MRGIANRANVHQRAWQERADIVEVDSETTFDLAVDDTLDHFVLFESRFQLHPGLGTLGLLSGQTSFTETVFYGFQRHFNFVTDVQGKFAIFIQELALGDDAFGFQSGMDSHPV